MEPELAISCNQAGLPVEGLGHQPSHKTLDPQFVLPTRCAGVKVAKKLWEQPTNDWSSLRPISWEGVYPPHHCPESQGLDSPESKETEPNMNGARTHTLSVMIPNDILLYSQIGM